MARPDARLEARLASYAEDVTQALGHQVVSVVLYGSAAGHDWIAGHSDVNTAIVVATVTPAVLNALVPIVARWRGRGFAVPLLIDREYLARARDVFAVELDDIRLQHRLLAGVDVFAELVSTRDALRRECEYEARGKLLRLRTMYLVHADSPETLRRMMHRSLTSFLTLLRHFLRLQGREGQTAYDAVVRDGELVLGSLPGIRRLLARRQRGDTTTGAHPAAEFAEYLADIERLVAAVDALSA
jgi:hypothetical protein